MSTDDPTTTNGAAARFTKSNDQLIGLGLPPRLVLLYGKLAFHAGKDGRCYPTHETLAGEIGLTSPRSREHVQRLLRQLQRLRLIEWKRGRYFNTYQVLDPDVTFLSRQMQPRSHISDVTLKSHRKEEELTEVLKEAPTNPRRPPSFKGGATPNICASGDARAAGGSDLAKIPQRAQHPEWFAAWWAIYWRKVSRKAAEKAFRAHVRTKERFGQVMVATRAQLPMMRAREPAHRPHGASWLNAERWNDEPEAPATTIKPPQASLVERTKALIAKRLANGERPI